MRCDADLDREGKDLERLIFLASRRDCRRKYNHPYHQLQRVPLDQGPRATLPPESCYSLRAFSFEPPITVELFVE